VRGELTDADAGQSRRREERERPRRMLERPPSGSTRPEAATQARLASDPDYRELRDAAEAAERVAVHADEKATLAEAELAAKGEAYEADPLFAYLWRRGYGTAAYRAWPLARWLDGRVARLIGYEGARRNYHTLQELPVRLREHADRVGAAADAALAGSPPATRPSARPTACCRSRPRSTRPASASPRSTARWRRGEEARQAVAQRLEAFARGEDPLYLEAVALLTEALGRVSLKALAREAIATPLPEDDRDGGAAARAGARRETATVSLAELREAAARHKARATDLERVRIDFTRRRYDQPGSVFVEGAMIATLLAQLLDGAMTRDGLWRVLEGQRRVAPTRSDPTFGSGGFGRGSPWGGGTVPGTRMGPSGGFGGTQRAGGGIKTGGSIGGGGGGGGFKTGGRIGGGGFKTGGKF
jgi:hypothetical protein